MVTPPIKDLAAENELLKDKIFVLKLLIDVQREEHEEYRRIIKKYLPAVMTGQGEYAKPFCGPKN